MKYKVTYEYRGRVTVEVEADSEAEADKKGLDEADLYIAGNLAIYDSTVREA